MTKEFAPMLEEAPPRSRNKEIIKEVWDLVGISSSVFLDPLGPPKVHHTPERMNARLQELIDTHAEYSSADVLPPHIIKLENSDARMGGTSEGVSQTGS